MSTPLVQTVRFSPLLAGVLLACGCSDFTWNPYRYQEWKQDEEYSVTFHQRVRELDRVRQRAASLGPRSERTCRELAHLYQHDKDPLIREEVVRTAAQIDHPISRQILQQAIRDEDSQVRIAACRGLEEVGGPDALRSLTEASQRDAHFDVRMEAVRALGAFQDAAALQALGLALEDADPALQFRAVESLKRASGRDFGNDIPAWRQFLAGETPEPNPSDSFSLRLPKLF